MILAKKISRVLNRFFIFINFSSPSTRKSHTPPRLDINTLDFSNREHVAILEEMGILLSSLPGGKVQISHLMQKAKTPEDAEEGWHLMQDIMRLMNQQQNPGTMGVREGGGERERIQGTYWSVALHQCEN